MKRLSFFLAPLAFVAFHAMADAPADPQRPQPQPQLRPQPQFDPSQNYYCQNPCGQPPVGYLVPVPPPVVIYVIPAQPPVYYGPPPFAQPRPYWGPRPGYGYGRPGWGGGHPGHHGHPGFRRMSFKPGCEIQQGNNGEFVVLSAQDQVVFKGSEQNAEIMKSYYEKSNLGVCPIIDPPVSI